MGRFADFLFKVGYYPIEHQSVKRGFLDWYYQAAHDELVIEGLDVSESQLRKLALDAATDAENFDANNPVIGILDIADEKLREIQIFLAYLSWGLFLLGMSTIAISMVASDSVILGRLGILARIVIGVPPKLVTGLYRIIRHQLKENSVLLSKFNKALVEKPGQIRRNDREWRALAAQYFWNRSLGKPRTIHALILLSVIKVASPKLYGEISGELHDQIREFIGKDAATVLKRELKRGLEGEFGPRSPQSDPPPRPLSKPPPVEEYEK